jgi:hypothetical protein
MAAPPNNPLKLPTTIVGVFGGLGLIGMGLIRGSWVLALIGAILTALSCVGIKVIGQGQNPWWMRAPLDYLLRRKPG